MKFGGASVATPESFSQVADIIVERLKTTSSIVVVVSAMGGSTDELIGLAKKVHPKPPEREQDMLISAGERISIALLAMALANKGVEAKSFTGSQSGIITTCDHSNAKIVDVRPHRILKTLKEGKVAIVAGFQGMSTEGEITTLGRGGSDTSAVAIAIAVSADCVEFYKDVAGVYSHDPKREEKAILYEKLSYQEAIDIVRQGAKVLHARSVQLAQKNLLPLHVLSFCSHLRKQYGGTLITEEFKMKIENKLYEEIL